jgi:hypothetical protein
MRFAVLTMLIASGATPLFANGGEGKAHQPASPVAKAQIPNRDATALKDVISIRIVNNRLLDAGSWTMNAEGKGIVVIKSYLGHAFPNRDSRVGQIRFAEGAYDFDIGPQGYALVKAELKGIIEKELNPFDGLAKDCGIQHPGFTEMEWQQKGVRSSFQITSLCPLKPEIEALREKQDNAWLILGRLMMRLDQKGVAEELALQEPLVRTPFKLAMNHSNVWTGNHIDWEVDADGKGWFQTHEAITLPSPAIGAFPTNYVKAGKHDFDIGNDGYAKLRREFDTYIFGPASKKECEERMTDQPMARLFWEKDGKMVQALNTDTSCLDYGDRVKWAINYLAAQVGEPTVQ